MECDPVTISFLDVRVNLINGYLLTETYSKRTDIHQYLNPTSCDPGNSFKAIPRLFQGFRDQTEKELLRKI